MCVRECLRSLFFLLCICVAECLCLYTFTLFVLPSPMGRSLFSSPSIPVFPTSIFYSSLICISLFPISTHRALDFSPHPLSPLDFAQSPPSFPCNELLTILSSRLPSILPAAAFHVSRIYLLPFGQLAFLYFIS